MTSYREAGVDLEGAERHVESIAKSVQSTWGSGVVGGFGGFAAGVRLPADLVDPILMMSTDGVGTKIELARAANRWEGLGDDLVAMCVDDLTAVGARPIGFVDYMAVGSLQPIRDTAIVKSIADACAKAGCPLLGGETAEHPGVMDPDAIDLAGAATGVVDRERALGPERVSVGDVIIGLHSPNVRSNGFSLIRRLFEDPPFETLLEPSVIYSSAVLAVADRVNSAAHITGGGLPGNVPRSVPDNIGVRISEGAWEIPSIFNQIEQRGVNREEMYRTFNMGVGFILVVSPDAVESVIADLDSHRATIIGSVTNDPGYVMS